MSMNLFGIPDAIQAYARVYFSGARASGRTTAMLGALNDGDRVYFADQTEAERFERLATSRGKTIECRVIPVSGPGQVFDIGTCKGKAIFDHSWVEKYYLSRLEDIRNDLTFWEQQTSGWGEAHEQTRLRAKELSTLRSE